MKKHIIALAVAAAAACTCVAALAGCADEETSWDGSTVTITCLDASGEEVEKDVPLNPGRVAILDYAVLDIMDAFGVGDTVVSTAEGTIAYLQEYWDKVDEGEIANLGTLKDFSLETLQQSEPDIIFIGGRQSSYYAELEEIAPVVYLSTDAGNVVEDTLANVATVGTIFGKTDSEINAVIARYGISSRVSALSALAVNEDGSAKTCLNIMWNSASSFSALADDGRLSIIGNEIGFTNLNETYTDSQHGSSTSWEAILQANPDYVFVMNRAYIADNDGSSLEDAAAAVAAEMQEELTKVGYTGTIVVLLNPDVWYTGEGGIQALATMLGDLETAFGL